MNIQHFEVGSEHWVDVTHINNPLSFYVRPVASRSDLDRLSHRGGHVKQLYPGQKVVYKSKLLKRYVRGRVLFITCENAETSDLFAPDYGCFEKSIPLKDIYESGDVSVANVPPLAAHCQLADCKPITENCLTNQPDQTSWSSESIDTFKFYIGKERTKIIIRGRTPDSCIVEMYNSCPDDIATMLAYSGNSTLGYVDNMISRFAVVKPDKHYYRFKEYKVDESIVVRVQTGDSLKSFFVSDVDSYKQYLLERDSFNCYCKTKRGIQIEEVEVTMGVGVLIITLNRYERAVVKAIDKVTERVTVMLVDWGSTVEVPLSRLKPMSANFFELPAVAIHCSAEECQKWETGLPKFLYPGFTFRITFVRLGEQLDTPHTVHLSQATDT